MHGTAARRKRLNGGLLSASSGWMQLRESRKGVDIPTNARNVVTSSFKQLIHNMASRQPQAAKRRASISHPRAQRPADNSSRRAELGYAVLSIVSQRAQFAIKAYKPGYTTPPTETPTPPEERPSNSGSS